MTARIETRTVGQHFGTVAIVRGVHGRKRYVTRVYPYGFDGPAIADAQAWLMADGGAS